METATAYFGQVYLVSPDQVSNSITLRQLNDIQLQVREFRLPSELLQALPLASPACFLIDLVLPEMSGPQLLRVLRQQRQFQPCIFTSTRIDPVQVVSVMNQGAFAFLKKPFNLMELNDTVQRALASDHAIHRYMRSAMNYASACAQLSPREVEMQLLLEKGHTAKSIATTLGLSTRTVENYRLRILRKLGVRSTTELVRTAAILAVLRASGSID